MTPAAEIGSTRRWSAREDRFGRPRSAALPAALAGLGPAPAGKYKTITRTFVNPNPIAIPGAPIPGLGQANPYPSVIQVRGFKKGQVKRVSLRLFNFNHTFPDDVDVLLVAPDGVRRAVVMSDVGDNDPNAVNLTIGLDDRAAAPMLDAGPLTGGTFKPTNFETPDNFPAPAVDTANVALATFKGIDPNGPWSLYVNDDGGGDTGSINGGWALTITARVKNKKRR